MSTNAEAPEIVEEEEEQEAPEQGKPTTAPAPKAKDGKQEASAPKQHPWTKDLEQALESEDPHDALNQIMTRSQSYTTGVEQELSQYREMFGGNVEVAQLGAGILMSLENEPLDTLVKIAMGISVDEDGKPVFDPEDLIVALENHFFPEGYEGGDEEDGPPAEDSPDGEEEEQLTPEQEWVRQKQAEEELEEHRSTYRAILDGINSEMPGFDEERFHMLVQLHRGDLEAAFDDYMAHWHKETEAPSPAPPSLAGSGGSLPPAEAKEYTGFGEAADDFLSELRASRS